jgi:hypothetical protein
MRIHIDLPLISQIANGKWDRESINKINISWKIWIYKIERIKWWTNMYLYIFHVMLTWKPERYQTRELRSQDIYKEKTNIWTNSIIYKKNKNKLMFCWCCFNSDACILYCNETPRTFLYLQPLNYISHAINEWSPWMRQNYLHTCMLRTANYAVPNKHE